MKKIKIFQIGDQVTTYLRHSSGEKKKIVGTIKEIKNYYGSRTYTITNGAVEDFNTRIILK